MVSGANSWDHPLTYFILHWVSKLPSNLSNGCIRHPELEFGQLQAGGLALYALTYSAKVMRQETYSMV